MQIITLTGKTNCPICQAKGVHDCSPSPIQCTYLLHVSAIKVLSISISNNIIPGFTTPLPLGASGQNTCVTP